jgi:hypothetical protein
LNTNISHCAGESLITLGLGRVIASRAAAVKPKAYQTLLLIEFGFFDSSRSAKDAHVPYNEPESGKVLGHNLTDRAFRLIGLNLVVQILFCLVPELVVTSLRLTRFFPKLMRTGSYFFIGWHGALLCRVPPISRSIAFPRSGASMPGHLPIEQASLSPHVCSRAVCGMRGFT